MVGGVTARETQEGNFYSSRIYPLALNVYYEARGEPELGQLMVAYVTLKRAEENRLEWGGNTIFGVVFKGCQFSWTCSSDKKTPSGPAWDRAKMAAILVATGAFQPDPIAANARYYMNPDTSDQRGKCWMATNLRQVALIGHHYFYAAGTPFYVPPRFNCTES
jgi:spore germination cell wall hydrolase CwlJ-like protein